MKKSIHQLLKDAGVPIHGHYSDIYVPVNDTTTAIIKDYEFKGNVTKFVNRVEGGIWYDIPFANEDYKKPKEEK